MRVLLVGALAAAVGGCSITRPVAVISNKGQVLRGSATAALSGGSFEASDGKLTCGGSYNALSQSEHLSFPVLCNDGRKGIVTAVRDESGLNGHGRVRLSDGTEADFVFGDAATAF